jgi:hypothetical protein
MKLKYHRLKAWWCPAGEALRVAMKLKDHRLKPGGVPAGEGLRVAMKLKYHRLKPGGVRDVCPTTAEFTALNPSNHPIPLSSPILTVVCMGHTVNFIHFLGYALPAFGHCCILKPCLRIGY